MSTEKRPGEPDYFITEYPATLSKHRGIVHNFAANISRFLFTELVFRNHGCITDEALD